MASSYEDFKYKYNPYSIIPIGKALSRLIKDDRVRDTIHGREYKCKRCDDWIPWDSEFYSIRTNGISKVMVKTCRVCERIKAGSLSKGA